MWREKPRYLMNEISRQKRILRYIEKTGLLAVYNLMKNADFMAVSLE